MCIYINTEYWPEHSFNLINNEADIDKIYLYAEDPCEPKYQFLIN